MANFASSSRLYWSDNETNTLIDSWGMFYQHFNGNLNDGHWQAIANTVNFVNVNARWTCFQCRDHVHVLRQRYESEKKKIQAWGGFYTSTWRFYSKVEHILETPQTSVYEALVDTRLVLGNMHVPTNIPERNVAEASNTRLALGNRRVEKRKAPGLLECLVEGINGFAKIYEKVEKEMVEGMRDLEKWRIGLTEELDKERRQMLADMDERVRGKRVKKSNQVTLEESLHRERGGSSSGKAAEQAGSDSDKANEPGGSGNGEATEQAGSDSDKANEPGGSGIGKDIEKGGSSSDKAAEQAGSDNDKANEPGGSGSSEAIEDGGSSSGKAHEHGGSYSGKP